MKTKPVCSVQAATEVARATADMAVQDDSEM